MEINVNRNMSKNLREENMLHFLAHVKQKDELKRFIAINVYIFTNS